MLIQKKNPNEFTKLNLEDKKLRLMISSFAFIMDYDIGFIEDNFLTQEDYELFFEIVD